MLTTNITNLAIIFSVSTVAALLIFYATIGALWMHSVKAAPVIYGTCDVIERTDRLWCKARMNSENDTILIGRE